MSFISEQVREIAELQENLECMAILQEAADTIEALSAKLKNNGWILCSKRMPEERESIFAKLKGTNKWNSAMFEGISDEVNATVEFKDGTRKTKTLYTVDGKWTGGRGVKFRVIAWQPLPEPHNPDRSSP